MCKVHGRLASVMKKYIAGEIDQEPGGGVVVLNREIGEGFPKKGAIVQS